jgi:hypothetical protein
VQAKPTLAHTRNYSDFGALIIGENIGYSFAKYYIESTFLAIKGYHYGAFLWAFPFLHQRPI